MSPKDLIKEWIEVNPDIQHGKPCIKGTRTPVYVILEALATMSLEKIQQEFRPISQEAIRACMSYAALLANEEELTPR